MKKIKLEIIVFFSGGLVMILEIAGSRVLAPYLGTSLFVWTSIIGIILASLSLGYYLGGSLADKRPNYKTFSTIILLAAIAVGIMTVVKVPILDFFANAIKDIRLNATLLAIILFSPASVLLGMVSPYAVRLKLQNIKSSGKTVGKLYAISTIGSITGTFLAGFTLIPNFGTSNILYIITILLIILSIIAYSPKVPVVKGGIFILIIASFIYTPTLEAAYQPEGLVDIDTSYNRVWIFDNEKGKDKRLTRFMKLNKSSSSAMYVDSDELVYLYSKYFDLAKHFSPDMKEALLIGGAAYSYPKHFLETYPEAHLDVIEIDPQLTEIAREYFRLEDHPNLSIFHEDGRTFLNNNQKKYDVIFGDAYKSLFSVPFQLTTVEAAQKTYDSLNDGGVVFLNIISAVEGDKGEFLRAEYATFKAVFPQVYVFVINNPNQAKSVQNIMMVGIKSNEVPTFHSSDPQLETYLNHLWKEEIPLDIPILTDEYAPVDTFVEKML